MLISWMVSPRPSTRSRCRTWRLTMPRSDMTPCG
jgi:hypothetical protein